MRGEPGIIIYEVFKKILITQGQASAEVHSGDLEKGQVVAQDASMTMSAAMISSQLKLPMADSMILAVAREFGAVVWTQDEHFKDLPGVKYIEKKTT